MSIKHTPDQGDERSMMLVQSTSEVLHAFLDAAAGEGLVLGGVDAADLYIAIFPERYAKAIAGLDVGTGAAPMPQPEPTSKVEAVADEPVAWANPVILLPADEGDPDVEWTAKVQGNKDETFSLPLYLRPTQQALSDAKDAERYRWLRGGMRKTRRPDDAPYVVNPRRSKLYAVVNYAGEELDAAIDEDRLNDMTQWVYEEALTEGDNRFADPNFRFSDEFANECTEKARAILAAAGGSEK